MWTVGVIGTGSFGQKRVQTLLSLVDEVDKVIIFDQNTESSEKLRVQVKSDKLEVAPSVNALLENPSIDIVCISTPNATHAELCLAALQHGKHVLCEKPITADRKVARRLNLFAEKNSVHISPGTNHRYFPSVQKALELLKTGKLGKVRSFHASIGTTGERIQNSWFWKKELSGGGTFLDNGHHLLDLAKLFCGQFTSVFGHTSRRRWNEAEVEDYALAIYENEGSEAVLRSSWRQPNGYLEIEIWGSEGSLNISVGEKEVLTFRSGKETKSYDFSAAPKTSLAQEMQSFFSDCKHADEKSKDSAELLNSLTTMISAFYTSQKTSRRVKLKS